MENVDALILVGLVGVTLVISVGSIFDPLRDWLKGFEVRSNPLRVLGELMSCPMCSGWWVGFAWGIYSREPVFESIIIGGVVSVMAFMTDEVFALMSAGSRVLVRRLRPMPPPHPVSRRRPAPEEPASEFVPKTADADGTPRPLTEDEAHAVIAGGSSGE